MNSISGWSLALVSLTLLLGCDSGPPKEYHYRDIKQKATVFELNHVFPQSYKNGGVYVGAEDIGFQDSTVTVDESWGFTFQTDEGKVSFSGESGWHHDVWNKLSQGQEVTLVWRQHYYHWKGEDGKEWERIDRYDSGKGPWHEPKQARLFDIITN